MRKGFNSLLALSLVAISIAACGDDDSDFSTSIDGDDFSSSSSSEKSSSSSEKSSSSSEKSSSSSETPSSSSETPSSSSQGVVDPATVVRGVMTDSRDGQEYKVVTIGSQTWLAENLNFETEKSKCPVADSSCTWLGRLYTWFDATECNVPSYSWGRECESTSPVRGVCPEGWHLPSIEEWRVLQDAVGGLATAGKVLKSSSGWYDGGNGSDDYFFSVLPVENFKADFPDEVVGEQTFFWSSTTDHSTPTEHREYSAYTALLYFGMDYWDLGPYLKDLHASVRCIKD